MLNISNFTCVTDKQFVKLHSWKIVIGTSSTVKIKEFDCWDFSRVSELFNSVYPIPVSVTSTFTFLSL